MLGVSPRLAEMPGIITGAVLAGGFAVFALRSGGPGKAIGGPIALPVSSSRR